MASPSSTSLSDWASIHHPQRHGCPSQTLVPTLEDKRPGQPFRLLRSPTAGLQPRAPVAAREALAELWLAQSSGGFIQGYLSRGLSFPEINGENLQPAALQGKLGVRGITGLGGHQVIVSRQRGPGLGRGRTACEPQRPAGEGPQPICSASNKVCSASVRRLRSSRGQKNRNSKYFSLSFPWYQPLNLYFLS